MPKWRFGACCRCCHKKMRRRKKKTANHGRCTVFGGLGEGLLIFQGGVSGTQEEGKNDKRSVPFTGSAIKNTHTLPCVRPGPSLMSLPSLPRWSRSEFGSRPQQSGLRVPPATDPGSVRSPCASNLTGKGNVHIWPVISRSGRLHPAPDSEYLSEVVKVEKKKLKGLFDRTGMCNKSYSNSADWVPFLFFFLNCLV